MKNTFKFRLLFLSFGFLPLIGMAQFDDLYFNPAEEVTYTAEVYETPSYPSEPSYNETLPSYSSEYDDYDYWDDQGYFYSSRVRRFHQPYGNFGYYDPVYSDMGFYDPWMMPGSSIYVMGGGYNDYWQWRRMNRWQNRQMGFMFGFNTFNNRMWMDPWSYNSWGAFRVYDPWFDPYWGGACFNRGFGPGWGYGNNVFVQNNYYGSGWNSGPGYWYGNNNGTVDNNPPNTYYGPRVSDARTGPARTSPRDPEYTGGGIPRMRDLLGTGDRPATTNGVNAGQQDRTRGTNPTGRDVTPSTPQQPATRNPEADPIRSRPQVDPTTPTRQPAVVTPSPDVLKSDGAPVRGTITLPSNERRDPLGDRQRHTDVDAPRPQTDQERSRDAYRDNYIRQLELNGRPVTPQLNPRAREEQRSTSPQRREDRPTPQVREQRSPTPQQRPSQMERRSTPSRETPSRGFESPSRSNPSSGGMDRGSSGRSNSSSESRSPSSSGGRSSSKRGG